jgi:hypothetical protein
MLCGRRLSSAPGILRDVQQAGEVRFGCLHQIRAARIAERGYQIVQSLSRRRSRDHDALRKPWLDKRSTAFTASAGLNAQ